MSETLKAQLESLGSDLPVVPTRHYVMFTRSHGGPAAFLMERVEGEETFLTTQMVVEPVFHRFLQPADKGPMRPLTRRKRYKFRFTDCPRSSRIQVKPGETPSCNAWVRVAEKDYEKLRNHDAETWEDVLCMLLDIPPSSSQSSAKSRKKDSRSGGNG